MAGFLARFRRAETRVMENKGTATRKAVIDLFQRVVNESPFDTGRFKGNWQISSNRPKEGTLDREDPNGSQANAEIAQHMASIQDPLEMEVWLVNNLPYAEPLEYGYSDQAPEGMVRVNVAKFPRIVAKYAKQEGGL